VVIPAGVDLITTNPANGSGTMQLGITAPANPTVNQRSAVITVGGVAHTVTQAGLSISLNPTKAPFISAAGKTYTIAVTANGPWAVVVAAPSWVTATPTAGNGAGTVTVTVAPYYTGSSYPVMRSTTITIGGIVHTIVQDWRL
jgi:hypothetical protein